MSGYTQPASAITPRCESVCFSIRGSATLHEVGDQFMTTLVVNGDGDKDYPYMGVYFSHFLTMTEARVWYRKLKMWVHRV